MILSFNCLVAQSGGPTAAINASLAGVIQASVENPSINKIYGALNGILGILRDQILDLSATFKNAEDIEVLKSTPAMYLGSCRYKLDTSLKSNQYQMIFDLFKRYDIKYFFYIGGNDSMDTVARLATYAEAKGEDVKIIGIPKTIDNDLVGTDHTPGFGSAAKFVAHTILDIAHDTYIYDQPSITIIEVMGRNAGWLTASAALARNDYNKSPDLIYLPEVPFSTFDFLKDCRQLLKQKKNIIIAVSEGIKDEQGHYISSTNQTTSGSDGFGHGTLSGVGKTLESLVKTAIGCKVRSIELSVLQRSAMHCASKTDLDEAYALGQHGVMAALDGQTGVMLTLKRRTTSAYQADIETVDVRKVANQEKKVPLNWINPAGNDVTEELIAYLQPLVAGEPTITYKNGLPQYMNISHLTATA